MPDKYPLIFDTEVPEACREIARRIEESEAQGREVVMRVSDDGEMIDLFAIEPTFEALTEFYEPVMVRDAKRAEDALQRRQRNVENASKPRKGHPRKDEALTLATGMHKRRPDMSYSAIGVKVASEMGDDAPAHATIARWLKKNLNKTTRTKKTRR